MLVNGDTVNLHSTEGRRGRSETVKIIDFERPANNTFLCVNQFEIARPESIAGQSIFANIVLFINGLPLALIETTSPNTIHPMELGIDRLMRLTNRRHPQYLEGVEPLFWTNQLMVSSCFDQARVGTISSEPQHFAEWRNTQLPPMNASASSQQILIHDLFDHANFLDLIQHFILFETIDGRMQKRFERYQKNRAVNKTIQRIKSGVTRKEKGGVIWHI